MIPKKISLDKLVSSPYHKNLMTMFKKDDFLILINQLSNLLKNFTKMLKNNISLKKEAISFIDSSTNYAYSIVNNIINHNYSFDQLKSLNETLIKIKEKSNDNKINILNEEQNLILFLEQIDKLFKTITNKQKMKIKNYVSNTYKTNSNSPNIRLNKYNLGNSYNFSRSNNSKRNNSQENQENSIIRKKFNIITFKRNKNSTKNSESKNLKSEINSIKSTNLFNERNSLTDYNTPTYITKSSYNSEVTKYNKIKNTYFNNKNLILKYESLKKKNSQYQENIQRLNKLIDNYKNIIGLLSKNKSNKEIIYKNKQITLLSQENDKLKKNLEIFNNFNQQRIKYRNIKKKVLHSISDNSQIGDTDANNTSYSFNNADLIHNNYLMNLKRKEKEIRLLKHEKIELEKFIKSHIERGELIEKEKSMIKNEFKKNNLMIKELENEINKLNKELKNEINKNEDLNSLCQNQKIKFEYEISIINDKRAELSKLIANKNNEIIKLQKELVIKNKEFEDYKLTIKKKIENNGNIKKVIIHYENIINEKNKKEFELNNKINNVKKENDILQNQNEKNKNKIKELNKIMNQYEKELSKKNEEINKIQIINNNKININNMSKVDDTDKEKNNNEFNILKEQYQFIKNENNNLKEEIKKLKDENEGLKEFTFKIKEKEEKITEKNIIYKDKIFSLQKENDTYKQYFTDRNIDISMPTHDMNKKKSKNEENSINLLNELNEAQKEINILKKKNEQLFTELESKKFEKQFGDNYSEGNIVSNYEEEFDLKKMAKGAKDKNRSQDINIDYPGAQQVKEKYRELDFYYNSLEELVKKLLLNCTYSNKNKVYITELCKIVGFEDDVINKIVNNKSKKGILNVFG